MTEPTKEQQEVINILENLIRVSARNGISVAGFAFCDAPMMLVNFGNCTDLHDIRLYEALVNLRNKQIERGVKIESTMVSEVN